MFNLCDEELVGGREKAYRRRECSHCSQCSHTGNVLVVAVSALSLVSDVYIYDVRHQAAAALVGHGGEHSHGASHAHT